jgi:uncharacterized membrane protein
MFRGDSYTKPKLHSVVGALLVAGIFWFGANASYFVGYLVALLSMFMIIVGMYTESIWPKQRKQENVFVFSLFWGCMVGGILPFLISRYMEGGFEALYEIFREGP